MTTVAITGASGYLGRVFAQHIATHSDVTRVIGVDIVEPPFTTRNLEFYLMDVRSPDLVGAISSADVLVHLAFTTTGTDADVRDVNVGGTRLALEAAKAAGVRRVVVASSTMAYGAHADNPFPLTEDAPLRPVGDIPHSAHNAEAEEYAQAFAATHADIQVSVLRLCPVFGPTLSGTAVSFVEAPYALAVRGYEAPAQALHEADAARALAHVATNDLPGVYNACPDDHVPAAAVTEILGQRRIELDPSTAERIATRLDRWRLAATPTAFLQFLMYPWVASNSKLRATGFLPEFSTEDALRAGAEARRGWVAVGPARFRPRRVALVAGSVGAVIVGSLARSAVSRRQAQTRDAR